MKSMTRIKSSGGFALLEPIIAAGLIGGLIFGSMQFTSHHAQSSAVLDQRLEVLSLRSLLLASLDCGETLPDDLVAGCPSGQLDMKNGNGRVIIAAGGTDGTEFGKLWVRAHCLADRLEVEVRPKYEIVGGRPIEWKGLFPKGLEICQGNFIPPKAVTNNTNTTVTVNNGTVTVTGPTITVTGTTVVVDNPHVNVCEEVGEFRYDACIARGKKAKKCERKEARTYRKCMRWASRGGDSVVQ